MTEARKDSLGGLIPVHKDRARKVDLVTLPSGVSGASCANCEYYERGYCSHPEVHMPVNRRMCCARWDAPGTRRAWEKSPVGKKQSKTLSSLDATAGGALVKPADQRTIKLPRVKKSPFLRVKDMAGSYGTKAGFSGRKEDSAGRERCYQDGKLVPCSPDQGGGKTEGTPEHAREDQPRYGGDEGAQIHGEAGGMQSSTPGSGLAAPGSTEDNFSKNYREVYTPDPGLDHDGDGVADAARVGVPARDVPPPPREIPRLPNLTHDEREAERAFMHLYLRDPDGVAQTYIDMLKARKIGDAPNVFNTDDAKLLSPHYNPKVGSPKYVDKVVPEEVPEEIKERHRIARSKYNTAVHQTANAIAKKAFLKYLDDVVMKLPDDRKVVLVTSGGVAAGKGYALKSVDQTRDIAANAGVVWDAAGEQNATENPWIFDECKKRGLKMVFAYIHADPHQTWENPQRGVVERAGKIGRMVDARVFADSYAYGAQNFRNFMEKYADDPDATFFVVNNATGGAPKAEGEVPEDALSINPDELYSRAVQVMRERKDKLKPAVFQGGTMGMRIWGPPRAPVPRIEVGKGSGKSYYRKAMDDKPKPKSKPKKPGKKAEGLEELSQQIMRMMITNITHNHSKRDEIDDQDFERSLSVDPLQGSYKSTARTSPIKLGGGKFSLDKPAGGFKRSGLRLPPGLAGKKPGKSGGRPGLGGAPGKTRSPGKPRRPGNDIFNIPPLRLPPGLLKKKPGGKPAGKPTAPPPAASNAPKMPKVPESPFQVKRLRFQ